MQEIETKIQNIRKELNSYFIERAEEIDLALTALFSSSTMVMLGPPGTGKSMLIRSITSHIEGANYFEWLLTRFSTPEELFGALDINALKRGEFIRNTKGKLPEAHIAFVDEIFKANSAILNSILSIINERIFYNDGVPVKVPLISLFSASNELPEEDSLKALYDRLIIRKIVEPIQDFNQWVVLAKLGEYAPETKLTLDEINRCIEAVKKIPVDDVIDNIIKIRLALKNRGIEISDRRFRQGIRIVQAYAFTRGKQHIDVEDLEVLQYILWDEPEQIPTVRSIVLKVANPISEKAIQYLEVLDDFEKEIAKHKEISPEIIEIYNKLNNIITEIQGLKQQAKGSTVYIDKVLSKAENMKKRIAKDIIKISF